MAETVISPSGPGAIDAGLMIDENGQRFVILTFKELDADPVLVTFTLPLFQGFAGHLVTVANAAADDRNWRITD